MLVDEPDEPEEPDDDPEQSPAQDPEQVSLQEPLQPRTGSSSELHATKKWLNAIAPSIGTIALMPFLKNERREMISFIRQLHLEF